VLPGGGKRGTGPQSKIIIIMMNVYVYVLRRKFYCAFWYKEAINDRYELMCKIFQSFRIKN